VTIPVTSHKRVAEVWAALASCCRWKASNVSRAAALFAAVFDCRPTRAVLSKIASSGEIVGRRPKTASRKLRERVKLGLSVAPLARQEIRFQLRNLSRVNPPSLGGNSAARSFIGLDGTRSLDLSRQS
jgi:hypothetical protein